MHLLRQAGGLAALALPPIALALVALALIALSVQGWPGGAVLTASLEALTEPVRHLEIQRLPRY